MVGGLLERSYVYRVLALLLQNLSHLEMFFFFFKKKPADHRAIGQRII